LCHPTPQEKKKILAGFYTGHEESDRVLQFMLLCRHNEGGENAWWTTLTVTENKTCPMLLQQSLATICPRIAGAAPFRYWIGE
jgi:hypothetical protein